MKEANSRFHKGSQGELIHTCHRENLARPEGFEPPTF
jgi:hypothetical protein